MDEILVSVVIPVKNGEPWLEETLTGILSQKIDGKLEVIVVDSGSTDQTLKILGKFPIRLKQINQDEFNHGLTRNIGVRETKGKYVVLTVQDAKPVSAYWIQYLLDGFVDETVVGVCGQQIVPHDLDKNPVDWFRPISKPVMRKYFFADKTDFEKLSPDEKLSICKWDDVNAMYKREVLMEIPFRETDFAEDVLWAKEAILAGHAIVYNPASQVEHYHSENFEYAFQRNFIVRYHFYKYFGVLPGNQGNSVIRILKNIKILLKESRITLKQKWDWLRYNYRNQKAVKKSNDLLLKTVRSGKQIDAVYKDVCKSIPQAIKSSHAAEQ